MLQYISLQGKRNAMCGCGGIGRRVRFRFLWSKGRAGSSPVIRTNKNANRIFGSFFLWRGSDRQNLPEHGRAVCALHARADKNGKIYQAKLRARCKASPVIRTNKNANREVRIFHMERLDRQNLHEHGRAVCALHARADMQGRYIKPYCALAVRQVLSSAPLQA